VTASTGRGPGSLLGRAPASGGPGPALPSGPAPPAWWSPTARRGPSAPRRRRPAPASRRGRAATAGRGGPTAGRGPAFRRGTTGLLAGQQHWGSRDLLSVDLSPVHVLHRVLSVVRVGVLDVRESFVNPGLALVVPEVDILDLAKRSEDLLQVLLHDISGKATDVNLGGGRGRSASLPSCPSLRLGAGGGTFCLPFTGPRLFRGG